MTRVYYWNQENFEGLLTVAAMADERGLARFAEYCRLRERGLRRQALAALRLFVAQVLTEPEEELLKMVEFACHHLSETVFLGSEADAKANLQEAHKAIAGIADSDMREQVQREHDALALQVRDWEDFQRERATGSFSDWCQRRGHTHSWWSIYYYDAK